MLKELLQKNRSYRRFYEDFKIDNQILEDFVNSARYCPSSKNQQAFMFRIVNNEQQNEKVFPLLIWAGYLKNWNGPEKGERPSAYIVLSVNKQRLLSDEVGMNTDLGILAQSIALLAVENGLGCCMIASFNKPTMKSILEFPEHIEPRLILAIGKPKENIQIVEIEEGEDIKYYRKNDIHYVPKRKFKDINL